MVGFQNVYVQEFKGLRLLIFKIRYCMFIELQVLQVKGLDTLFSLFSPFFIIIYLNINIKKKIIYLK